MSEVEPVLKPDDGYETALCDKVLGFGRDGYSLAEIAAELGVPRSKIHDWMNQHPEFRDAMSLAADWAFAWWERKAREGLEQGAKLNTTVWSKSISARFPAEAYGERRGTSDSPAVAERKPAARLLSTRERAKAIAFIVAKHRAQSL